MTTLHEWKPGQASKAKFQIATRLRLRDSFRRRSYTGGLSRPPNVGKVRLSKSIVSARDDACESDRWADHHLIYKCAARCAFARSNAQRARKIVAGEVKNRAGDKMARCAI